MSSLFDKPVRRRHHDWEMFDEVHIRTVPRYKTSDLSGDEWRVSAVVELKFKGAVVLSRSFSKMSTAIRHLAAFSDPDVVPDGVRELEETCCDQPGCPNTAVSVYEFKKLYSARGEELAKSEKHFTYYAKFCKKHLRRGDGGREDGDKNYIVRKGPGPDGTTNSEESPAVFAGVLEMKV